ncbi:MAG: leucyl/phenylalanyl-tRNA--protein transferase [Rhodobacteraceae bacterium]|nr:leucyl/phenylalanyl-tRNA--protein transferase [Paracoccaceae bacterium]
METGQLTPELLLRGYAMGVFPMAETRSDPDVFWVDPRRRGIMPLNGFHISRSLARKLRQNPFAISFDTAFGPVLEGCARREETWINDVIFDLYLQLHEIGFAHSVEVWDGRELVGGVYGVALSGAFFGESMFSDRSDASKIALAYLVDRLRICGFSLFDTQFITPHLARLGAQEITRVEYHRKLARALRKNVEFDNETAAPTGQDVLQRNTQTS